MALTTRTHEFSSDPIIVQWSNGWKYTKLCATKKVCRGCLLSKQVQKSFPLQSKFAATKKLLLIHGDLCGPITTPTPGGNMYFFLLVDDFTQIMWVYMLRTKDEAWEVFKKFRVLVEKEAKSEIKIFRSDWGGEFTSNTFEMYCNEAWIQRHLTAPYSPQQNGVVERRNRFGHVEKFNLRRNGSHLRFGGRSLTNFTYRWKVDQVTKTLKIIDKIWKYACVKNTNRKFMKSIKIFKKYFLFSILIFVSLSLFYFYFWLCFILLLVPFYLQTDFRYLICNRNI